MLEKNKYLTPRDIVEELDKYIIGQQEAKRNVAIALRNRWRRMHVKEGLQGDIMPNNILMIGPTGVGKTEIARRLAKIAEVPFIKVEASKFTEVGYIGRDVESMIRDLVERAVAMVKELKTVEVQVKAALQVEEFILDRLIPPATSNPSQDLDSAKLPTKEVYLNEGTREHFRKKLQDGELDDKKIEINLQKPNTEGVNMIGGGMIDESAMMNLQDILSNMMPKQSKKSKVTIGEARKILLAEEVHKLIDMSSVKAAALEKVSNSGIIFIDEIDKIAVTTNKGSGPSVSREGVQRDLLPIVEGSAVNTKYGIVNTDHILFIAAGAFHIAKPADLIPELQGRFPIRVNLETLTQKDFYRILEEPKSALPAQYEALLGVEGVTLTIEPEAKKTIAEMAYAINEEVENIGARRLHTVMSQLLNELLFDVPDKIKPGETVVITEEIVGEKLSKLVKSKDLSQYIL